MNISKWVRRKSKVNAIEKCQVTCHRNASRTRAACSPVATASIVENSDAERGAGGCSCAWMRAFELLASAHIVLPFHSESSFRRMECRWSTLLFNAADSLLGVGGYFPVGSKNIYVFLFVNKEYVQSAFRKNFENRSQLGIEKTKRGYN